ncbi:tail fiber assembly protein [Paraburkholderia sp. EG304]|uniref:tail fiber assembly protein n=1 Tax=Paraburkholderia sp. EG304 TaxID=3237015 RepID=UPI00397E5666
MGQKYAHLDADRIVIGFYDSDIHGENVPADAVEIADETWATLLDGQSAGKRMSVDENGGPVLLDYPPPTDEQIAVINGAERSARLSVASSVAGALEDAVEFGTATEAQAALLQPWRKYRAQLLAVDLTAYPAQWPDKPAMP